MHKYIKEILEPLLSDNNNGPNGDMLDAAIYLVDAENGQVALLMLPCVHVDMYAYK